MLTLLHTSALTTAFTVVVLVLIRISESVALRGDDGSARLMEQIVDLSDHLYAESKECTDDLESFRLKAMTLSLLQFASAASLRSDALENLTGYSVARRVKHIEQDMTRLRQNIAASTQRP